MLKSLFEKLTDTNKLRNLRSDESGAVLIIFSIVVGVLLIITFLSIDGSKTLNQESRFRNAVDQALLSVASKSSQLSIEEMQAEAQGFFDINYPDQSEIKLSSIEISFDPLTKEWTGEANAVVKGSSNFSMNDSTPISHVAKVKWDESVIEVVFAVDISASMCTKFDEDARLKGTLKVIPDEECTKLGYVKEALNFVIGGDTSGETAWAGLPTLKSTDGEAGYKIGIVPFNHKVKMPNLDLIPEILTSSEVTDGDSSYFTQFNVDPGAAETDEFPLPEVMPLVALYNESDRNKILNKIADLNTNYNVPGWTRSNLGFLTSTLMLDPQYSNYFLNGSLPNAFDDPKTEKIIFLLSDGANMGCCFSSHNKQGTDAFANQYLYSYRTDNQHLVGHLGDPEDGLCGQVKNAGVTVYTIVYDVQDNDANGSGAVIKDVMKECSSGNSGVNFYDLKINEGDKIKDAYQEIARSLMRLKLVY